MEIRHLTYRYGNRVALNDFSCTLQPGICGLLGPNGAGKSTLMKLLCDLMPRDQGEILTSRGTDIRDMGAAYRAQLGYVPQQQGFYGSMSAYRFLLYMASLKKIPGKIAKTEIDQLLDLFHLTEDANRRLDTYSGGMKQRIMLSQAFLGNPRYLILDEPTVGLDPGEQDILCRYIRKYRQDAVVLWSTHIVREIEAIADTICLMRNGQVMLHGTVPEILDYYHSESLSEAYRVCMEG